LRINSATSPGERRRKSQIVRSRSSRGRSSSPIRLNGGEFDNFSGEQFDDFSLPCAGVAARLRVTARADERDAERNQPSRNFAGSRVESTRPASETSAERTNELRQFRGRSSA